MTLDFQSEDVLDVIVTDILSYIKETAVLFCDEPAESIGNSVFSAGYGFQVESLWCKLATNPSLLGSVELRFCQNVSKRVVIGPNCKIIASLPMTKLLTHTPFQC